MSVTKHGAGPAAWATAEIDDLQDTVEDLEVELEETRKIRDQYHDSLAEWQDKFHSLNRTMYKKIEEHNVTLREKAMVYLDLIDEYAKEFSKVYTHQPGLVSNVKIKHLRQEGEIDL